MEVPGAIATRAPISIAPLRLEKEWTVALSSMRGSSRDFVRFFGLAAVVRTTIVSLPPY
jgi:hypothetical protein